MALRDLSQEKIIVSPPGFPIIKKVIGRDSNKSKFIKYIFREDKRLFKTPKTKTIIQRRPVGKIPLSISSIEKTAQFGEGRTRRIRYKVKFRV